MSRVKLTQEARLDIRRDAERSCVGASVGDTLRLLDDYDALAQRYRDLEVENTNLKTRLTGMTLDRNCRKEERDTLRAEVERLREIREIASQCAANGGYLSSADLIELRELLKK